MRILYLIPRFPVLSQTFISREVLGLAELGHDIHVAAFGRPTAEDLAKMESRVRELHDRVKFISLTAASSISMFRAGFNLNRRIQREATMKGSATLRLLRAIAVAKLARKLNCDHLHAHWPAAAQVAAVVHAITGLPYSVSIHAHEVAHDSGHFPCVFETLRFAAFCNKAAMEYLLARLPDAARGKSHLIYHGVDLDRFRPQPLPPWNGELHIVSAGRNTPSKGFERLERAVKLAGEKGVRCKLTIIGDKTTGWMPHNEVPKYLADAHVFALLADDSYHDGLPNVVLEAMAVGRPVILSPLPAAREAIVPGENGWILSTPAAMDEFVGVLRSIVDQPAMLNAMSANAAEFVRQNHDQKMHLAKLSRLFA